MEHSATLPKFEHSSSPFAEALNNDCMSLEIFRIPNECSSKDRFHTAKDLSMHRPSCVIPFSMQIQNSPLSPQLLPVVDPSAYKIKSELQYRIRAWCADCLFTVLIIVRQSKVKYKDSRDGTPLLQSLESSVQQNHNHKLQFIYDCS